jgi:hypothetical protein
MSAALVAIENQLVSRTGEIGSTRAPRPARARSGLICLSLSVGLCPPFAAFADEAGSDLTGRASCAVHELTYETRELACLLGADSTPRRYRLQVNFSGGHDDTIASIASVTLDGTDVLCADGSKTRLVGEDGDVNVNCVFTVSATAAKFLATFRWTHAEYTGFSVTPL